MINTSQYGYDVKNEFDRTLPAGAKVGKLPFFVTSYMLLSPHA
jgi:hypothetical protein